ESCGDPARLCVDAGVPGIGLCGPRCTPSAPLSACSFGPDAYPGTCVPIFGCSVDGGACFPAGTVPVGSTCQAGADCVQGALCVPVDLTTAVCAALCDPGAPQPCPGGEVCNTALTNCGGLGACQP